MNNRNFTIEDRMDALFNSECQHIDYDNFRVVAKCPRCIIELVQAAVAEARAEEREGCAEACDEAADDNPLDAQTDEECAYRTGTRDCAAHLAAAIRARGEGEE